MAKRKNESNRARRIRRGVVGKYKVDTTNSKKRGGGDGSKKGTKRSGRFAGMTTEEIRDFRATKKAQRDTATATTDTTTEDFEMADFQGMLDTQADLYTSQLDGLREQQRLDAEQYRREQAAAQRQFELDQRTMLGNEARAGQQTEYKFGSISGRKRGGTFGFRRRKRRLMGGIGSAVSAGSGGGTLNM